VEIFGQKQKFYYLDEKIKKNIFSQSKKNMEEEDEVVEAGPESEEQEEIIEMGLPIGMVEEEASVQVGMSVGMVVDYFTTDTTDFVPFVMYESETTNISGYAPGRCSPFFAMIKSMMGTHTHDFVRLFKMARIPEAHVIKHVPAQQNIFNEETAISIIEDCCATRDFTRAAFVCMFQNPHTGKISAWWSGRNANKYDSKCHMYYALAKTLDLERAADLTKAEEDAIEMFGFIHPLESATMHLRKMISE
jgi:hypothetical protein